MDGHARSLLVRLGALAWLLVAVGSTPASADETREYRGTWDGRPVTVVATCAGDTCDLTTAEPFEWVLGGLMDEVWTNPVTTTGGRAAITSPDTCGQETAARTHHDATLEIVLTPERLTATVTEKNGRRTVGETICWSNVQPRTYVATAVAATASPTAGPGEGQPPTAAGGATGAGGASTDVADGSGGSVSRLATGAGDAPSVLSGLRRAGSVEAGSTLVAVLVTVVLVLLVAFPTSLLNSASEQGTDRLSSWWRKRRVGGAVEEGSAEPRRTPWWWAAGGVLAAGVVSSFVDPQFGLNAGSLRTMLSVLLGFAVEVVIGWLVVIRVVRRSVPGAEASFTFRPATLLLVALAVVFTRVTGFEPGIVFGLVAGVGFATLIGRVDEVRAALVPLAYGAAVGLLAWAAYHLVADATGTVGVFVAESLSAMAVAGLAALPIALFPVAGLPGATVFDWDRRVWAGCYAFGLLTFFVVLMPTPYAWDEVGWSLRGWLLVYLAYVVVALSAWWVVRRGSDVAADEVAEEPVGGPPSAPAV